MPEKAHYWVSALHVLAEAAVLRGTDGLWGKSFMPRGRGGGRSAPEPGENVILVAFWQVVGKRFYAAPPSASNVLPKTGRRQRRGEKGNEAPLAAHSLPVDASMAYH